MPSELQSTIDFRSLRLKYLILLNKIDDNVFCRQEKAGLSALGQLIRAYGVSLWLDRIREYPIGGGRRSRFLCQ